MPGEGCNGGLVALLQVATASSSAICTGIERRALAEIVRHAPQRQAVIDRRVLADAADEGRIIADALDRGDVSAVLALVDQA